MSWAGCPTSRSSEARTREGAEQGEEEEGDENGCTEAHRTKECLVRKECLVDAEERRLPEPGGDKELEEALTPIFLRRRPYNPLSQEDLSGS